MAELTEVWALVEDGLVAPEAAVARVCGRIEAVDDRVRAFVPENGRRERLLTEARAVAERWGAAGERPALFGVPVGIKDVVRVDGLPTRAGSALPPEALAGPQAGVVHRLRAAGALIAGKTVTAEFAVIAPGQTANPHDLAHTPGGSSSGSAAAVAAGMVPLAIGTQTVGSVVRPAAYCGVVGFKPSHGRIPADGVIGNSPTFDTLGLFATDLAGVTLSAAVLCDDWHPVPTPDRPVLGVPVGPYLERAGAEALAAFGAQVTALRVAGFDVREVPFPPDFERLIEWQRTLARFELARVHERWFGQFAELYRPQTAEAIRAGRRVTAHDHARALRRRADFQRRLADAEVDGWLTPAATGPAPAGLAATGDPVMCLPWSYAGVPSLSLPAGFAANGLPLGLQCVGRSGADEALLHWAAGVEQALNSR